LPIRELFSDEIGDMDFNLQAKLLKALEEQNSGASAHFDISVKLPSSAATSGSRTLVKENQFRLDLYYRLNVIPIEISPSARTQGGHTGPCRTFPQDILAQFARTSPDSPQRHVRPHVIQLAGNVGNSGMLSSELLSFGGPLIEDPAILFHTVHRARHGLPRCRLRSRSAPKQTDLLSKSGSCCCGPFGRCSGKQTCGAVIATAGAFDENDFL
jgi:hypothetical protein